MNILATYRILKSIVIIIVCPHLKLLNRAIKNVDKIQENITFNKTFFIKIYVNIYFSQYWTKYIKICHYIYILRYSKLTRIRHVLSLFFVLIEYHYRNLIKKLARDIWFRIIDYTSPNGFAKYFSLKVRLLWQRDIFISFCF